MCCLSRVFVWVDNALDGVALHLPHDVVAELFRATLQMPMTYTDIRAQVNTSVTCSDATTQAAAIVETCVSQECAETLFKHCEQRGADTRPDWKSSEYDLERWNGLSHPSWLENVVEGAPWRECDDAKYKKQSMLTFRKRKVPSRR